MQLSRLAAAAPRFSGLPSRLCLPQGFVSPAVLLCGCRVIFGMLIALPITLVYYILMGL
jgi:hypothetical protein